MPNMFTTVMKPTTAKGSKPATMEAVQDRLIADLELDQLKRRNTLWALGAVSRACGMSLPETPADPSFINEKLKAFAPATIGLAPSTWTNALALLRFAFRRTGVIKAPARQIKRFAAAWTEVMRLPSRKNDLIGLSRFARFCSEHGIDPEQVDDAVFVEFL